MHTFMWKSGIDGKNNRPRNVAEGRRCKSWTRKYYRRVNEKCVKCKMCGRVLRTSYANSTGNIHRHIKLKHPYVYFNENKWKTSTQDDDSSDAETVQQSMIIKKCKQRIVGRRNDAEGRRCTSWTRKYYSRVNEKCVKCKICGRVLKISYGNSTGNIHRHIKLKHPSIYFNENKSETSTQDDDSSDAETVKATEPIFMQINTIESIASNGEVRDDDPVKSNIEKAGDNKSVSLDDEESMNIKKCKQRIVGRRQAKSVFWNFFEKTEQDRVYKCSFCEKSIVISSKDVFNLKRHIACAHKKEFEIIMMHGGSETNNLIMLAASGAQVPGVSTIDISFSSLDDNGNGKFRCSRCNAVIESTEENSDAALIEHVQMCKLISEPLENESNAEVSKSLEDNNDDED